MDIESSEENKNKKDEEIYLAYETFSNIKKQNELLINKNSFSLETQKNKIDIFNDNNNKNEYNNNNKNDFFLEENALSNGSQNQKKEKKNLNLELNINSEILEIRKKISELAAIEESSPDEKSNNKSEKLIENKSAVFNKLN